MGDDRVIDTSTNSFAKDVPSASSNSFAKDAPAASTNSFSSHTIEKGGLAWEGDDLTDAPAPGDQMSYLAPGIGEYGGVAHFKSRTLPTITH